MTIKLQKLQLHNFKSFKKASVPFSDGFTAIAGANGSGKSNILDSLLFVTGITSLKLLRAGKLTDLVNNEASDGEARVDLIIEQEKEGAEKKIFELSRSINRSGKSIYRINNERTTLNEVASLLQELSIDPNGHNIVVQGDITRIIGMNPKERREILDEAAGIKEFDDKKEESLKELGKVESKIKEARIVLHERELFLKTMEEERLAAQKYNELTREAQSCKATLLQLELNDQKEIVSNSEKRESVTAQGLQGDISQKQVVDTESAQLQKEWDDANNQLLAASSKAFEGVGKVLQEKQSEKKILEHELNSLLEREKELGRFQQTLLTTFSNAENRLPALSEEVNLLKHELDAAKKETEKGRNEKSHEKWQKLLEEKNRLEGELQSIQQHAKNVQAPSGKKNELEQLTKNLSKELESIQHEHEKLVKEKHHEKWQQSLEQKHHLSGQIQSIAKSIEKIKQLQSECPTCEQGLPENYKDKVLKSRVMEQQKMETTIKEVELLIETNHTAWKKELGLQQQVHALEQQLQKIKFELEKEIEREKQFEHNKNEQERGKKIANDLPHLIAQVNEWNDKRLQEQHALEKQRSAEHALSQKMFELERENERLSQGKATHAKNAHELQQLLIKKEKVLLQQQTILEQIKLLQMQLDAELEKNKDLSDKKEVLKAKLHQLQEKRLKFEEAIRQKEKQLHEIGIEKSKSLVRITDLEEEIKNFTQTPRKEDATLQQMRERIPKLEKEIQSLGAINMKALDNVDQFYKEMEEINSKAKKLEEERIAVLDMINNIGIKRQEAFMQCFVAVNEKFSEIYYTFFEGEGKLELNQAERDEDVGLLIQARHKGEKLKSIDLMSGGEKTLTALAFLFAIQMYAPSPFYVFDEADAALDKENSMKLARMIRSISESGQFIAITHNDALIKNAQQIVGVALNKQNSSVIGLKLEDAVAQHHQQQESA